MGIKLNIGAGGIDLPGFTPIDIKDGKPAFPLDYPDGSVEEIYSSHMLEHLPRGDDVKAVAEWFRVLKPGGRIRIAVPDFDRIVEMRRKNTPGWEHVLMGGNIDEHDLHKSVFVEDKLRYLLTHLGFDRVGSWTPEYPDTASFPVSLRLGGYKPDPDYTPIKLNIGAGDTDLPGFTPIDIQTGTDASGRLPYDDNSVDEVYASHVLEHIHHQKTEATLREWLRVLKPGGLMRIAVPDHTEILIQTANGVMPPEVYNAFVYGSIEDPSRHDRHQAVFTSDSLGFLFKKLGMTDVGHWEPEFDDCTKHTISLNLCGRKRAVTIKDNPKVSMVLSCPRVGFVDLYGGVTETCRMLGWKYRDAYGTEWGKGLTCAVQQTIAADDPDYIFCLDYDSVFSPADAKAMLDFMQAHPEIGAAYPVEAHRHLDGSLGFDATRKYEGEFTEVSTGHFGCTIIRREVFNTLPQPWFISLPNPITGTWSQSLDADINFWVALYAHGWKSVQINGVQIGHMELCVKWLAANGVIWQPITHYKRNGKPTEAMFNGDFWHSRELLRKQQEEVRKQGFKLVPLAELPGQPEQIAKPAEPRIIPEAQAKEAAAYPGRTHIGPASDYAAPAHSPKNGTFGSVKEQNESDMDDLRKRYAEMVKAE